MTTETETPMSAAEKAFSELGFEERFDNPDEGIVPEAESEEEPEGEELEDEGEQAPDPEAESEEEPVEGESEDEGEGEEEEDGTEEESSTGEKVEVPESGVLVLPDGTEVDAEKAVLFQQDYTKKTQELADGRRELEQQQEEFQETQGEVYDLFQRMSDWYEERSSDPGGWIVEIAAESSDPTRAVARALKGLADAGKLDPEFVETFGLESGPVAEAAESGAQDERLARIEQELQQQKQQEQEQQRIQQYASEYQRQWNSIKQAHGLRFDSPEAERDAKAEVLQFARDRRQVSLEDAYDLLAARKARQQPAPAPTPDPATTQKKRASRAITPKSTSGGGGQRQPARRGKNTREAALIALEKFAATDA